MGMVELAKQGRFREAYEELEKNIQDMSPDMANGRRLCLIKIINDILATKVKDLGIDGFEQIPIDLAVPIDFEESLKNLQTTCLGYSALLEEKLDKKSLDQVKLDNLRAKAGGFALDSDNSAVGAWEAIRKNLSDDRTRGRLARTCGEQNAFFRQDPTFQARKEAHALMKEAHALMKAAHAPIIKSFSQEEFDQRNNGGGHQKTLDLALAVDGMQAFLESTGRTPLDLVGCYGDQATDKKVFRVISESDCRQIVRNPEKFDELKKRLFPSDIKIEPPLAAQPAATPRPSQ